MKRRLALVSLVLLAASTGCGSDNNLGGPMPEPSVNLQDRPPLPVVMAEYERLLDDVQRTVDSAVGDRKWTTGDNANSAFCQDTGSTGSTASRIGDPVTNQMWPRTQQAISEALSRHGFDPPQVLSDSATLHSIQANDKYGATFLFNNTTTVLRGSVVSGCHRDA